MKAANVLSYLLNTLFGILALASVFVALMSFLMFDNPAASRSIITWNFAASFFVYPYIYRISIARCSEARRNSSPEKTLVGWALFPFAGIAWILIAYLMLEYICHGKFGCN